VRRSAAWALLILALLALLALPIPKPTASADTGGTCDSSCSIAVSPTVGSANSTFDVTVSFNVFFGPMILLSVAVITPNGQVYVCNGLNSSYTCGQGIGGDSSPGACTIPFGNAGDLNGSGGVFDCGGSNSVAWQMQTSPQNLAALESSCGSGGDTADGSFGVGSTSETGTYTAIDCWLGPDGPGLIYATTTFTAEVFTATATQTVTTSSTATTTLVTTSTVTSPRPTTTTTTTTTATSTTSLPTTTVTSTETETSTSPTTMMTTEFDTTTETQSTTSTTTSTLVITTASTYVVAITETVPTTTTLVASTTTTLTVTSTQTVTATSTQTSTATSTQRTTTTSTAQPPSLTVESVNQNGQAITGYYAVLRTNAGQSIAHGYTTVTFNGLTQGTTYAIELDGYGSCQFSHWKDSGSSTDPRTFTASGALTLVGVYNCGSSAAPAVGGHKQPGGVSSSSLTGLVVILSLVASSGLGMTAIVSRRRER
jgi:hypothetical protein